MDETSIPNVFDYGCTIVVTPYKNDFVGPIKPSTRTMNGMSSSAPVEGEGSVSWDLVDDYGVTQQARIKAFLVPASKVRIFSPQVYFQQYGSESFTLTAKDCVFIFTSESPLSFGYAYKSNLPIVYAKDKRKWQPGIMNAY